MITSFVDAFSEDRLLQITTTEDGDVLIGFHLYDSRGASVEFSNGLECFKQGRQVRDEFDELLLLIPLHAEDCIHYRLYSQRGTLLTCSDGVRTQLFSGIRIESTKYPLTSATAPKGPPPPQLRRRR